MTAKEHYRAGRLAEALAAATQEVKAKPTDVVSRRSLCELLCFAGDLDRADVQLDAISQLDSKAMLDVALFRHLLRAEQARRDFHAAGRLPEFIDRPSPELRLRLEASIALRESRHEQAMQSLSQAEEQRPRIAGVCDGQPFDDLRDLDDLTSSFLEVLTSTGKYYWTPFEKIETIEFSDVERMRDVLWREANLVVRGGPDGEVYLPALYEGSHHSDDEHIRLGRVTDWRGGDNSPVRGLGQRTLLVGETDRPILEIKRIEFASPQS